MKHKSKKIVLATFCAVTFMAFAADATSTPGPKKEEAIDAEVVQPVMPCSAPCVMMDVSGVMPTRLHSPAQLPRFRLPTR